ncbi:hypothetical protein GTW98_01335 [Streptomyces sp. SID8375]|uniref:hypothetical protein n=1 Tax=unclassified Streptomyces TaxID=2593676 RepID=UPI0003A47266|nr:MULTISPECIES: hypothetical protein [unclassified Streptomyces]MYX05477.1 hypothetical protein [Streptomyces sp. SID8375]
MWHALLIALIVWQHTAQPYRTDGGIRLDVLDPGLWSGWIWPILAGLVGLATLDAIRAVRVWTRALAVWSVCAEAAFALPLAWVLHRQEFFNPAFLSDVNGGWQTPDSFYTVAVAGGPGGGCGRGREAVPRGAGLSPLLRRALRSNALRVDPGTADLTWL